MKKLNITLELTVKDEFLEREEVKELLIEIENGKFGKNLCDSNILECKASYERPEV